MPIKSFFFATLLLFAPPVFAQTNSTAAAELVSVKRIWPGESHDAFTDLIRFKGKWFCTFREAEAHVGGNGKIRLLTSKNGEQWESSALLSETGIDLRDPKLSITPDNRLMLVLGGSVYEGKVLKERQSRVAFSKDGKSWSEPQRVLEKGDWLWRVTWHKGIAYGISYDSIKQEISNSPQTEWTIKLVKSTDGVNYKLVTMLDVPGRPNETTVRFLKNGDCVALVRREAQDKEAWIGKSSAPYKDWKWHPAGMQIGGPNFIVLKNDVLMASGRRYAANWNDSKTFVGRMNLKSVSADLIFPSGGDCSYAGMVWHDDLLWMSYYSSHEGGTDIYLAKVKLPKTKLQR